MTDILTLISNDTGIPFHKKSSTMGGEYSGSCPWCGGEDRFSIHPDKNHFVCRKCKKAGDSISFAMQYHGLVYREACKLLGVTPQTKPRELLGEGTNNPQLVWKPRETPLPPKLWQEKAAVFLFEAYKWLLSPAGKNRRAWLNDRGISDATIKQARLGWIDRSAGFDSDSWGLTPDLDKNGLKRQIWIPAGLIIPFFLDGFPVRLRVRQSKEDVENRFLLVIGSATMYFDYARHINSCPDTAKPALITESELDGWLLYEQLGDKYQIFASGSASTRPDRYTHGVIKNVPKILNLDDDVAGHAEQKWWRDQYQHVFPLFSEFGKDPGDSYQVGVDIRAWGLDGLKLIPDTVLKTTQIQAQASRENIKAKAKELILKAYLDTKPEVKQENASPECQQTEDKPRQPRAQPIPTPPGACLHGLLCQSYKEGICLICKQPISYCFHYDKKCPKDKWSVWDHPSGSYSQIILGVGLRNRWAND